MAGGPVGRVSCLDIRPLAPAEIARIPYLEAWTTWMNSFGCLPGRWDRCALIALCGYMGLRVGEAINVRIYHVDIKNQWLEVKWGKGRRERELPIPDKAVQILAEACHGRPDDAHVVDVSDRTARRWITAAGVAAGITRPVASHDLRATAGTHWYRVTKDLRVTQELLGHADSRTTELYTGITDDAMRNAINQ